MKTTVFNPTSSPARIVKAAMAQQYIRDANAFLLDVRGFDEYAACHVKGAVCIPLPDLEQRAGELPTDRSVLVMCQSGGRSAMAAERLRSLGMNNIVDIQGGVRAWQQEGLPVAKQSSAIPLERQVRIAAGTLVLGFSVAGLFVSRAYFYGAALVGFMLALTGTLGICPMMSALKLLPWNRVDTGATMNKKSEVSN